LKNQLATTFVPIANYSYWQGGATLQYKPNTKPFFHKTHSTYGHNKN
jgi:hypothetical protein